MLNLGHNRWLLICIHHCLVINIFCSCFCCCCACSLHLKFQICENCKLPAPHYYFNCLPFTGTCEVPFYESSGVCVETCPQNEFGNHTSGQCEPCTCHFKYVAEHKIIHVYMKPFLGLCQLETIHAYYLK